MPRGLIDSPRLVLRGVPGHFLAVLLACLASVGVLNAQPPVPEGLSPGAKLYIAPMDWALDQFILAEIGKQGLPLQMAASAEQADFVMTGVYQALGSRLMSPGHYIQVRILAAGSGKQMWLGEANDYALFFGRMRRHGQGRAAEAIVRNLRRCLTTPAR
jgi:hypothetical protein